LGVRQIDIAASIVAAVETGPKKPVLAVLMGREGLPEGRAELNDAGIPAYIFPESAARALAAMHQHRQWRDRPVLHPERFAVDRRTVEGILDRALAAGRTQLTEVEALKVFQSYGIPTAAYRVAHSQDAAVEAAEELGFPVVLKILSPDVVHKSDVGGVRVELSSSEEVKEAYQDILQSVRSAQPDSRLEGVLVASFMQGGRELIVGVSTHPSFGPVLMFGMGGIYVEALNDVTFRIHPVTRLDAEEMIRSIRGFPLLEGVRGEPGADLITLVETIQRVSQLVGDHERIVELDLNPFLAFEEGGVAVDARIAIKAEKSVSPTPEDG
jgi:acetyltransferase